MRARELRLSVGPCLMREVVDLFVAYSWLEAIFSLLFPFSVFKKPQNCKRCTSVISFIVEHTHTHKHSTNDIDIKKEIVTRLKWIWTRFNRIHEMIPKYVSVRFGVVCTTNSLVTNSLVLLRNGPVATQFIFSICRLAHIPCKRAHIVSVFNIFEQKFARNIYEW